MTDSTQLSDAYLLDSSLKTESELRVSRGKKIVTLTDNNQGSYTGGLITIDGTTQLNVSQGFAALKEGYLTLPYVVTAKNNHGTLSFNTPLSRFACSLKTGVWNVISDLEVELNETSISDMYKHAADTNLYPDGWFSINYSKSASTSGDGYSNNQCDTTQWLDATLGQTQENRACNTGFVSKLNNTPAVIDPTTNDAFSWPSLKKAAITNIIQQTGCGGFIEAGPSIAGAVAGTWIYMLKIRLVDLHPLFKELDLVANPQLKVKLRVNAGTVAIDMQRTETPILVTTSANALNVTGSGLYYTNINSTQLPSTNTTMSINNVSFSSVSVVPIMVAPGANGQPMSTVAPTSLYQISFLFGALRNAFTDTSSIVPYLPYTVTRLNVPFYDLIDPRPIVSKPLKTIKYLDAYAVYYKDQCGSYMPGASVRNFQVQIGSESVFKKTHECDYETFLDEFSKLGAINGDVVRGVNTGLVDFNRWTYAQRVMVADCSRVSEKIA